MLLLPEGQTGEAWEPSKKQYFLAIRRTFDIKVPSLILQWAKPDKTLPSLLFGTNCLVVSRKQNKPQLFLRQFFRAAAVRGACVTQIVATRICRPADNEPCDGHPLTVPLGQNWVGRGTSGHCAQCGSDWLQVARSVVGFHGARAILISFVLPAVDLHEIRKYSPALCADPLCLIVPKSDDKCGGCGYEFKLNASLSWFSRNSRLLDNFP